MATRTFYVLATNGVAPSFWGNLQEGGTAPTGANTLFGYGAVKIALTTPYYRAFLGATTATQAAAAASSMDAATGPRPGTGTGNTTASDCFVSPMPYTGTFANTAWTFNWNMRCSNAGMIGRLRMRVWASVNANGSGARVLTSATLLSPIITLATTDTNASMTWSPGTITLNNEYLFFQHEWQETTVGTSNSDNALYRAGTASFITPDFAQINVFVANNFAVASAIAFDAGTLSQRQVLPAPGITAAGSAIFGAPELDQAHAFGGGPAVAGAPSFTAPDFATFAPVLPDVLLAASLAVGSPTFIFNVASAWTPLDLGDSLLAWLDASDPSTITLASGNVAEWRDKSIYSRSVAQGSGVYQPPYNNGKVGMYDQKALQPSMVPFPPAYDYIVVGKSVGVGKYHSLLLTGGGTYLGFVIDPSDLVGIWTDGLHQAVGLTWPADTEAMIYGTLNGAVNASMAKNGLGLTTINAGVPDPSIAYLGQPMYAQGFGDLYEIIFVPYGSSNDIKQRLEGYVANKWGLANLLPADHPYKTQASAVEFTQQHVMQAAPLTVQSPAVGTATIVVPSIPLAANSLSVTAPAFGTPALKPTVLLSAANLATAPPVEAAAAFKQAHALATGALASSPPAITVPTFNRTLAVAAAPLAISSLSIGAATFAQPHTLSAIALATSPPVLDVAIISQAGVMAALPLVTTPPTLGVGSLTQKQVLTASTTTTSPPSIASANLLQQHWFSATSVATTPPSVGVCVWTQKHVLNATPLTVVVPTVPAATLGQSGVMACIPIVVTSPTIGASQVGQKHVVAAQSLAAGPPALGSTSLSKVLSATALAVGAPVISPPLLTKVLTAAPLSLGIPAIGVPACALRVFDLTASGLAIGPPTIPALSIGQSGVMAAVPPSVGAPVLGAPAIGQRHVLPAAAGATVGSPVLNQGNFGQEITLVARPLAAGAPALGLGVLGQEHRLSAQAASSGRPALGAGNLGQAGIMAAIPLWVGSPVLPAIAPSQRQRFTGNGLTVGPLFLGIGVLGVSTRLPRPQSTFAGRFKPLPAVLQQVHRLTAQAASAGSPRVPVATMFERESFAEPPLVVSSPVLGAPALALIANFAAIGLTPRPELGRPTIGQEHRIRAATFSVGSPWIGYPRLGKPPIALLAEDAAAGAPAFSDLHFVPLDHLLAVVSITSRQRLTPIVGARGAASVTGRRGGNVITGERSNGTITGQRQRNTI